jgi:sulfur relay (sulfurtransferase) complex TusBCD TusD component (DsrE family)
VLNFLWTVAAHKGGKTFLSLHHEAKAGYDYCDGCSLRRGVFSTRSWCESCITDGFTKSGYARFNYMYPESEEMSSFNHALRS